MDIFFFIPIQKLNKIPDIQNKSTVDHIIIDLEESLSTLDLGVFEAELDQLNAKANLWVRPQLRRSFNNAVQISQMRKLVELGFTKFVLPKLIDFKEVFDLIKEFDGQNLEYNLLVEHPKILQELPKILELGSIGYVGLGSHDFFSVTHSKNTRENLNFFRRTALFVTKAFGVSIIDTASMEIALEENFRVEVQDALDIGMDGKFFIHPSQLNVLSDYQYFTTEEINWAKEILEWVEKQGGIGQFIPKMHKGKIIERPHVQQAIKTIKISEKWRAAN